MATTSTSNPGPFYPTVYETNSLTDRLWSCAKFSTTGFVLFVVIFIVTFVIGFIWLQRRDKQQYEAEQARKNNKSD